MAGLPPPEHDEDSDVFHDSRSSPSTPGISVSSGPAARSASSITSGGDGGKTEEVVYSNSPPRAGTSGSALPVAPSRLGQFRRPPPPSRPLSKTASPQPSQGRTGLVGTQGSSSMSRPPPLDLVFDIIPESLETPATADLIRVPGKDAVERLLQSQPSLEKLRLEMDDDEKRAEDQSSPPTFVEVIEAVDPNKVLQTHLKGDPKSYGIFWTNLGQGMETVFKDGFEGTRALQQAERREARLQEFVRSMEPFMESARPYLITYCIRHEQDQIKLNRTQDSLNNAHDDWNLAASEAKSLKTRLDQVEEDHRLERARRAELISQASLREIQDTSRLDALATENQKLESLLKAAQEGRTLVETQLTQQAAELQKTKHDKENVEKREMILEKSYQSIKTMNDTLGNLLAQTNKEHQDSTEAMEKQLEEKTTAINDAEQQRIEMTGAHERVTEELMHLRANEKNIIEARDKALNQSQEAKSRAESLERQMVELRKQGGTSDAVQKQRVADIDGNLSTRQEEKDDLEKKLRDLREEAEGLRQQVEAQQQEKDSARKDRQEVENKIKSLEKDLENLEQSKTRSQDFSRRLHEINQREKRQSNKLIDNMEEQEDELERWREAHSDNMGKIRELEARVHVLLQQLNDTNKERQASEKQIKELREEITTRGQKTVEETEGLRQQAKQQCQELEDKIKTLEKDLENFEQSKARSQDFSRRLHGINQWEKRQSNKLIDNMEEQEDELERWREAHSDNMRKIQGLEAEVGALQQRLDEANKKREASEKQIEDVREEIAARARQSVSSHAQPSADEDNLRDKIQVLEQNLDSRDDDLVQIKQRHDDLYKDYVQADTKSKELHAEAQTLAKELKQSVDKASADANLIKKLEEDMAKLLRDAKSSAEADQDTVETLNKELLEKTETIGQLREVNQQLQGEISELRERRQRAEEQVRQTEEQVQRVGELYEEHQKAEEQLHELQRRSHELVQKAANDTAQDLTLQKQRDEHVAQVAEYEKRLNEDRNKLEKERSELEKERKKLQDEGRALLDEKTKLDGQEEDIKKRQRTLAETENSMKLREDNFRRESDEITNKRKEHESRVKAHEKNIEDHKNHAEQALIDQQLTQDTLQEQEKALLEATKALEKQGQKLEEEEQKLGRILKEVVKNQESRHELRALRASLIAGHNELRQLQLENERRSVGIVNQERLLDMHEAELRRRASRLGGRLRRVEEMREHLLIATQEAWVAGRGHTGGQLCFCSLFGPRSIFGPRGQPPPDRGQPGSGCCSEPHTHGCSCKREAKPESEKAEVPKPPKTPLSQIAHIPGVSSMPPQKCDDSSAYTEYSLDGEEEAEIYGASPPSSSKKGSKTEGVNMEANKHTGKQEVASQETKNQEDEQEENERQERAPPSPLGSAFFHLLLKMLGPSRSSGQSRSRVSAEGSDSGSSANDNDCTCGNNCVCKGKCGCNNFSGGVGGEGLEDIRGHSHGRILHYSVCQWLTAFVWFVVYLATPFLHPLSTLLFFVPFAVYAPYFVVRMPFYYIRHTVQVVFHRINGGRPSRPVQKPPPLHVSAGDIVSSFLAFLYVFIPLYSIALWKERNIWLTDNGFRRPYLIDIGIEDSHRGWPPFEADYRLLYQPYWYELLTSDLVSGIHRTFMSGI